MPCSVHCAVICAVCSCLVLKLRSANEGPATKSGLRNPPIKSIFIGLTCGADQCMRIQLAKETRQLPVGENIQWPGVLVCESFPEGIMISEYAQI